MWLRERMGLESVPFVLAVMVAGVAMEMTSIALFASRVKGRLLLAGAIVLVGTQSLGNLAGSIAILLRPVHEEKSVACVLVPVLGILCAAVVFDAFAVGAGIWVWMRRRG
jgi:hypothetical protein